MICDNRAALRHEDRVNLGGFGNLPWDYVRIALYSGVNFRMLQFLSNSLCVRMCGES